MKKTITSLALILSATHAHALIGPTPGGPSRPQPVQRTICLNQYQAEDGTFSASDCDESERNRLFEAKLLENGCAKGQVAITTVKLRVQACPTAVQL